VLEYFSKDLISLLDVILSAQTTLHSRYSIDLSKAYSTASLAMLIFRTKFQQDNIPLLSKHVDTFIRNSYKGGATEVYHCVGKNMYYYDVNSLYPFVMKYPIPGKCLGLVKGAERYITKLLLNGLYGFLGRQHTTWSAEILPTDLAFNKLFTHPAYEYFHIDENHVFLLADTQPSKQFLEAQGITYFDWLKDNKSFGNNSNVLTNVALASAITSYARIFIIPVKTDPNNLCFYSDTDSIFIQHPLDPSLIGNELGQFKDELKGSLILEGYFLGDKFYGYKTENIEKVVVAGLPTKILNGEKTSVITFSELLQIYNGATLHYTRTTITKRLHELALYNITTTITKKLDPYLYKKEPVFINKKLVSYKAPTIFYTTKFYKLSKLLFQANMNLIRLRQNVRRLLTHFKLTRKIKISSK